jgi:hypothetical protein
MSEPVQSPQDNAKRNLQAGFLALAENWISRAADDHGLAWFLRARYEVSRASNDRALGIAIGLAPRRLGRAGLSLSAEDLGAAAQLRNGLDPAGWSVDQLARIALMVASYRNDVGFADSLDRFCATAEVNELIALYRGLPLYPAAALIEPRAREAIRSGMKPVFEAVAYRNPYPGEVFAEQDWNQMVVKAIFIGASLWPIQGLDRRGNPELARMLVALVQERAAAGRSISSEVWRCIAPHPDREGMASLIRAWEHGLEKDRLAIALALKAAPDLEADLPFRGQLGEVRLTLDAGHIAWRDLA